MKANNTKSNFTLSVLENNKKVLIKNSNNKNSFLRDNKIQNSCRENERRDVKNKKLLSNMKISMDKISMNQTAFNHKENNYYNSNIQENEMFNDYEDEDEVNPFYQNMNRFSLTSKPKSRSIFQKQSIFNLNRKSVYQRMSNTSNNFSHRGSDKFEKIDDTINISMGDDINKALEIEKKLIELDPINSLKKIDPAVELQDDVYHFIEKITNKIQNELHIIVSILIFFNN